MAQASPLKIILQSRLQKIKNLLNKGSSKKKLKHPIYLLRYCRRKYIRTMCHFLSIQPIYSLMLLLFIVFTIFLNVCFITLLIKTESARTNHLAMMFITFLQYFVMIYLHFEAVKLSQRLSAPLQWFIKKNLTIKQCRSRDRIRIALFIDTYHIKKKYGFTYGPFGLVSMDAFIKVNDWSGFIGMFWN